MGILKIVDGPTSDPLAGASNFSRKKLNGDGLRARLEAKINHMLLHKNFKYTIDLRKSRKARALLHNLPFFFHF